MSHLHGAELQEGFTQSHPAEQQVPARNTKKRESGAPLQSEHRCVWGWRVEVRWCTCGRRSRSGLCGADSPSLLRCRRRTGYSLTSSLQSKSRRRTSPRCTRGVRRSLYGWWRWRTASLRGNRYSTINAHINITVSCHDSYDSRFCPNKSLLHYLPVRGDQQSSEHICTDPRTAAIFTSVPERLMSSKASRTQTAADPTAEFSVLSYFFIIRFTAMLGACVVGDESTWSHEAGRHADVQGPSLRPWQTRENKLQASHCKIADNSVTLTWICVYWIVAGAESWESVYSPPFTGKHQSRRHSRCHLMLALSFWATPTHSSLVTLPENQNRVEASVFRHTRGGLEEKGKQPDFHGGI